jgi:hypothetical protein
VGSGSRRRQTGEQGEGGGFSYRQSPCSATVKANATVRADVHYGRAEQIISARGAVLERAYAAHPERFVRKPPTPPQLPEEVWINKPLDPTEAPQQFPG